MGVCLGPYLRVVCYYEGTRSTYTTTCFPERPADVNVKPAATDYALEVIGDFAQDRYLVLKSLDQAKNRSSSLLSSVVVERRQKYHQQMLRVEQVKHRNTEPTCTL